MLNVKPRPISEGVDRIMGEKVGEFNRVLAFSWRIVVIDPGKSGASWVGGNGNRKKHGYISNDARAG
jgi:hypothetical protein